MTWAQAVAQISTVLITGLVAVLSARYGARSSLAAAERQVRSALEVAEKNNRAALDRFRYERIHQKREQVIEELYAGLRDLDRTFLSLRVKVVYESGFLWDVRDKQKVSAEFEGKLGDVTELHDRNALWLEAGSSKAVDKLLTRYLSLIGFFNLTLFGQMSEQPITETQYDEAIDRLNKWAEGEYVAMEKAVTDSFRNSLYLDDEYSE